MKLWKADFEPYILQNLDAAQHQPLHRARRYALEVLTVLLSNLDIGIPQGFETKGQSSSASAVVDMADQEVWDRRSVGVVCR